jgi:hypothetical protein
MHVRADRRSSAPIAHRGLQLITPTLLRIGFGDSQKNPRWRVRMRREAVKHENFFIAKICDSESTQRPSGRCRRLATTSVADRSIRSPIEEMPAVQPLPSILTFADIEPARVFRFASRTRRRVVERRVPCALTPVRQRFLKLDAVFFDVLVYSNVVHLDSRVHAAIKPSHYIRRATWLRKLRRQRRRRAQ